MPKIENYWLCREGAKPDGFGARMALKVLATPLSSGFL
jgi:hypothetical protein